MSFFPLLNLLPQTHKAFAVMFSLMIFTHLPLSLGGSGKSGTHPYGSF